MNVAVSNDKGKLAGGEGVSIEDFYAFMPMHSYIFAPTGEMWPAASVNSRIPPIVSAGKAIKASDWLDQNRPVEQMTWAPGLPTVINDRLIADGGWIDRNGVRSFNLYRPPAVDRISTPDASVWLEHAANVFGDEAKHIINWLAHRVQRPHEKVNHALVLGGGQVSERILSSSQSNVPLVLGISPRYRRNICSAASTDLRGP
jgi:hypothetical protein